MKKNLLLVSAILSSTLSFSQTIFSENFDASLTLPIFWSQYNLDGLTPFSAGPDLSFMGTNAWMPRTDPSTGIGNRIASISYYSPIGSSDDWLVTPIISLPSTAAGYILQYDVLAQDPIYADGYKVYVSTTGSTVSDFTAPAIYEEASAPNPTESRSIDLSAYAGQSIYIAFRNDSSDKYILFLDNIRVRKPYLDDAILINSTLERYSLINTNNTLALSVKNDGLNPITSLTIDWNDGISHSSEISCNIAPGATATINHPTSISYSTAVEKTINITITNVNSGIDPNILNNTAISLFNSLSELPQKNVLFEVVTATWCGTCVEGITTLKQAYIDHPTGLIGIAVNRSDIMTVTEYDEETFLNMPSANVDREIIGINATTLAFENAFTTQSSLIPTAAISAIVTNSGLDYSINGTATFKTPYAAANLRLGAIISERNVVGTGNSYDQNNNYAGGTLGVMGGFELLTDPIPAANMVYQHVGRALLGGYNGQIGSVPSVLTDGQDVSYTFNYTVPGTSVLANMDVTIVLIDQANGAIINAKQYALASASIQEVTKDISLNVYPNPASGEVNIAFKAANSDYLVSIFDNSGRTIVSANYSNLSGIQTIPIPIPINEIVPGTYLITVATEGVSYAQQVIIK